MSAAGSCEFVICIWVSEGQAPYDRAILRPVIRLIIYSLGFIWE